MNLSPHSGKETKPLLLNPTIHKTLLKPQVGPETLQPSVKWHLLYICRISGAALTRHLVKMQILTQSQSVQRILWMLARGPNVQQLGPKDAKLVSVPGG